ncbi:MarR family winged helix-turn-helix transcriptional regulator [Rosistilla oblonga]|uniref:MarR family winged helix-turn-helix transcriptional regulator n=1 Tax=Rosistilla oblonga TaxID=2527990 RepID=UPI003A96F743
MTEPSLSDTLHRLMHAYKRQLRAGIETQQISLPITQLRVLKSIGRIPECTASSIAQRMNQDKGQLARLLNELTDAALIDKMANPQDRRSHFLVLTSAGKQILAKLEVVEKQAAGQMTRGLSSKEIKTFIRIAAAMMENSDDGGTSKRGTQRDG